MPDRSIRVSESIWRRAKIKAVEVGQTLQAFTEAALEARLRGVVTIEAPTAGGGARHVEAVEWPENSDTAVVTAEQARADLEAMVPAERGPTEKKTELF